MAEKLIKQFTIGSDTGKVDYESGVGGNKPDIATMTAATEAARAKVENLEDYLSPDMYTIAAGYPKITYTVAEGITGFAVKKGNQPGAGETARRDMNTFGRGYAVGYNKDGNGYEKGITDNAQFNAIATPSTASKVIMVSVTSGTAGTNYNSLKTSIIDTTTHQAWISLTKVKGELSIAVSEGTPVTVTGTSSVTGVTVCDIDKVAIPAAGIQAAKEVDFTFKVGHEGIAASAFATAVKINNVDATVGTTVEETDADVVLTDAGNKWYTYKIASAKITGDIIITISEPAA